MTIINISYSKMLSAKSLKKPMEVAVILIVTSMDTLLQGNLTDSQQKMPQKLESHIMGLP